MNTLESKGPAPGCAATRFLSLAEMTVAHGDLLRRHREAADKSQVDEAGFEASLDAIADFMFRARATGALLGSDADRDAAQGLVDYWTTVLSRAGREVEDITVEEYDASLAPELADELYPYPGTDPLAAGPSDGLCGRKKLLEAGLARLKAGRLLAVVGPTGSGKSSLVRCGLIPALQAGALPGSRRWRYPGPLSPGAAPLEALARLVPGGEAEAAAGFARNPGHLARLLSESGGEPAAIVVDHFEEIFTLCRDDGAGRMFVENLLGVVRSPDPRHVVILSMQEGFAERVARMPSLHLLFSKAQVVVTPPNAADLREAIERPAERIGLRFGDGVVDALIQDLLGEPEAFALLQFTLLKLWDHRERNRVSMDALRKVGGGRLAIVRAAEALFTQLGEADQGECKRILLQLARPESVPASGNGIAAMSGRRVRRHSLARPGGREATGRVLDRLAAAHLIRRIGGGRPEDEQIELVHDAVVRNWPRMIEWLADNHTAMTSLRRLEDRAAEWIALGRVGGLFDEVELREAERWLAGAKAAELGVSDAVRDLVRASREGIAAAEAGREAARNREIEQAHALAASEAREAGLARKRANLWRLVLFLAVVVLLLVVGMTYLEKRRATVQSQLDKSKRLAFQSLAMQDDRLDLALLIGLKAHELDEKSLDARSSILAGLQHSPRLVRYLRRPDLLGEDGVPRGTASPAKSVAVSPDGRWAASGYADGSVQLFELPASRGAIAGTGPLPSMSLEGPSTGNDSASRLAFSPDGLLLAEARQGTIRLWSIGKDGTKPARLEDLTGIHEGEISGLAFRPRARRQPAGPAQSGEDTVLASVGEDKGVVLTRLKAGRYIDSTRLPMNVEGDPGAHPVLIGVAFSPDGRRLASSGDDNAVYVWTLAADGPPSDDSKPRPTFRLMGHREPVTCVAFSPDGQTLASGGQDNAINLWSLDGNAQPRPGWRPLVGHSDDVLDLVFSPDGNLLASAGADGMVVLWEAPARAPLANGSLAGHGDLVTGVSFTPDNKFLVSSGADSAVILWDVENPGQEPPIGEILVSRRTGVRAVAASTDGELLASAGDSGSILLWDRRARREGKKPVAVAGHRGAVTSLALAPPPRSEEREVAGTPASLLASGDVDGGIILWDTGDRNSPERLCVSDPSDPKAWRKGGPRRHGVPENRASGDPAQLRAEVTDLAFSPDRKVLAASYAFTKERTRDGLVRLWDVGDPRSPRELPPLPVEGQGAIWGLDFSPDGESLAYGAEDRKIYLCAFRSREGAARPAPVALAGKHRLGVHSVAFHRDGKLLASGGWDGAVEIWDRAAPGAPLWTSTTGHRGDVRCVAFSPDGRTLASGGIDERVMLWDVELARSGDGPNRMDGLRPLIGHSDGVRSLAFIPRGEGGEADLASGSWDSTVMLWDVVRRAQIGPPLYDDSNVMESLASSADGRWLATDDLVKGANLVEGVNLYHIDPDAGLPPGSKSDSANPVTPSALPLDAQSHYGTIHDVAFYSPGPSPSTGGTGRDAVPRMLAAGGVDGAVLLWENAGNGRWKSLGQFAVPPDRRAQSVNSVAFHPDGSRVAAGWSDGFVTLMDVASRSLVGEPIPAHKKEKGEVNAVVAFSPDGKILVSGGADGAVRRWTADGKPLADLLGPAPGEGRAIHCVEFDPRGLTLSAGCGDGTIQLWCRDDAAGEFRIREAPIKAHRDEVFDLAFNPEGSLLASAGGDKAVRLWDVAAHRPLGRPLMHHRLDVTGLAFCRGGQSLASCSKDGTVVLWDVDVRRWQKRVEEIVGRKLSAEEESQSVLSSEGADGLAAAR